MIADVKNDDPYGPCLAVTEELPDGKIYHLDKKMFHPEFESYFDSIWNQIGEEIRQAMKKEKE